MTVESTFRPVYSPESADTCRLLSLAPIPGTEQSFVASFTDNWGNQLGTAAFDGEIRRPVVLNGGSPSILLPSEVSDVIYGYNGVTTAWTISRIRIPEITHKRSPALILLESTPVIRAEHIRLFSPGGIDGHPCDGECQSSDTSRERPVRYSGQFTISALRKIFARLNACLFRSAYADRRSVKCVDSSKVDGEIRSDVTAARRQCRE